MTVLDEKGKQCPIPVIETKKAVEALGAGEKVQTIVDNEIAAQNLKKFADQRSYAYEMEKKSDSEFVVTLTVTEEAAARVAARKAQGAGSAPADDFNAADYQACPVPAPAKGYIVVISSDHMGEPEEALGKILLKGFLYALSKKEDVPKRIIFYNGGAKVTCEGSESLEDLKELEKSGAEILTCGTCLKFQNLEDKLKVGSVTNMYEITEALTGPDRVVKPC